MIIIETGEEYSRSDCLPAKRPGVGHLVESHIVPRLSVERSRPLNVGDFRFERKNRRFLPLPFPENELFRNREQHLLLFLVFEQADVTHGVLIDLLPVALAAHHDDRLSHRVLRGFDSYGHGGN